MAFVAVDKNGEEWVYQLKPSKGDSSYFDINAEYQVGLPSGSIKKLIGRDLTWDDDPVELT